MHPLKGLILIVLALSTLIRCNTSNPVDIQETGQQIGDVMASMDEMGGNSGSLAASYAEPTFTRLVSEETEIASYSPTGIRSVACVSADPFSTFISFTWADGASSCLLSATGATVSRAPQFTATGRRGATLTVSKTGTYGQKITKTGADTFTFSNDGIKRVFAAAGATLFDFTTTTTADIGITGTARTGRIISGGTLRVANNLTGGTCDYSPTAVTWAASCNCAVSGSWSGSCSDGKTSTMTITGCGTATLTVGADSESFTFDRCYSI